MFDRERIKKLCYIIVGLVSIISIIIFVTGIIGLTKEIWASVVFIILGLITPILTIVSLYPIISLSNIEERLLEMDSKMDRWMSSNATVNTKKTQRDIPPLDINAPFPLQDSQFIEALNFVQNTYGISIQIDDSVETIQAKVLEIDDSSSTVAVFKAKIAKARTKREIANIIVMHKVVHAPCGLID